MPDIIEKLVGSRVRFEVTFRNSAGTPTNPASQTGQSQDSRGTVTPITPVSGGSMGVWYIEAVLDKAGDWVLGIKSDTTFGAADEQRYKAVTYFW